MCASLSCYEEQLQLLGLYALMFLAPLALMWTAAAVVLEETVK